MTSYSWEAAPSSAWAVKWLSILPEGESPLFGTFGEPASVGQ
jgi:hypothetical protein